MNERYKDLRIGVVLAGAMNKGAYEIGCIRAIEEYFGRDTIKIISSSSIGGLIAYSFATDQLDKLQSKWSAINAEKVGRFFPRVLNHREAREIIYELSEKKTSVPTEIYVTVWNFFDRRLEYTCLNRCDAESLERYLLASMSIPMMNRGIVIREKHYFDGSLIDNIPAYPLAEKNLDYVFCIYFDQAPYVFLNETFDAKLIKLNSFPMGEEATTYFKFEPERVEEMVEYGHTYTKHKIESIFDRELIEPRRALVSAKERVKRQRADVAMKNTNRLLGVFTKKSIK